MLENKTLTTTTMLFANFSYGVKTSRIINMRSQDLAVSGRKLNKDKSNSTPPTYTINNSTITISSNQRDLGIIISHNLSWDTHYSHICANVYRALNIIIRNIALSAPRDLKKALYISLVCSKITYCSQLWRPMHIKDITCLENIQRRVTKFIITHSGIGYKERLIQLKLFPVLYRYEIQDILYLIKHLQCPDDLNIHNHIAFVSSTTRLGSQPKL